MLSQVKLFFQMRGEDRFTDWDRTTATDSHAAKTLNRAGYRKHSEIKKTIADGRGVDIETTETSTEFFVFTDVFEKEICAGFDYRAVCKLLVRHGCLIPDGRGYTRKERLPGGEGNPRVFRITHKIFEVGGDE
jgi:putative DNA primase/helicase